MDPNLWQYMAMFISVQHDVLNHGGFVVQAFWWRFFSGPSALSSRPAGSGSSMTSEAIVRYYKVLPIGSMYGIYANIGGILMINVTIYIYIAYMDPSWVISYCDMKSRSSLANSAAISRRPCSLLSGWPWAGQEHRQRRWGLASTTDVSSKHLRLPSTTVAELGWMVCWDWPWLVWLKRLAWLDQ